MKWLLGERAVESYLPAVTRERRWADRRRLVQFPLFPGYVFGRFPLRDLHRVLTTPGVATVVRLNGRPAPIRDDEIENIRRVAGGLAATAQHARPHPFREGEWVRVMSGPFEGVVGVVLQLRGRGHVLAGLRTLSQGLSIRIDGGLLESIPAPAYNGPSSQGPHIA